MKRYIALAALALTLLTPTTLYAANEERIEQIESEIIELQAELAELKAENYQEYALTDNEEPLSEVQTEYGLVRLYDAYIFDNEDVAPFKSIALIFEVENNTQDLISPDMAVGFAFESYQLDDEGTEHKLQSGSRPDFIDPNIHSQTPLQITQGETKSVEVYMILRSESQDVNLYETIVTSNPNALSATFELEQLDYRK